MENCESDIYFYVVSENQDKFYYIGFTHKNNYEILKEIYLKTNLHSCLQIEYFLRCKKIHKELLSSHFSFETKSQVIVADSNGEIKKNIDKAISELYYSRDDILPHIPYFNLNVCNYRDGDKTCKNLVYKNGRECSLHSKSSIYKNTLNTTYVMYLADLKRDIYMEENLKKKKEYEDMFVSESKLDKEYPFAKIEALYDENIDDWQIIEAVQSESKTLVEGKTNIDILYNDHNSYSSLLGIAIKYNDPISVKLLLSHGADPNLENIDGYRHTIDGKFFSIEYMIDSYKSYSKLNSDIAEIREIIRMKLDEREDIILELIKYGIDLAIGTCKSLINWDIGYARLFLNRFENILEYLYIYINILGINMIILEYYVDPRVYKKLKQFFS